MMRLGVVLTCLTFTNITIALRRNQKSTYGTSWVIENLDKTPVQELGEATCCEALTATCLACKAGQGVREYCKENAATDGCDTIVDAEKDDHDDDNASEQDGKEAEDEDTDDHDAEQDKEKDDASAIADGSEANKEIRNHASDVEGTRSQRRTERK
eukprot:TRINITY_DN2631_c0_g1_i16.p3 TRINITY_DN2631_c0_g1~~TRINITY_DN2631_c0_g1_i16.p3  ORF type:complete len:156 (-),score=31.68 TRINITY_DN2631_c0_g1_i16:556-1023(-)